MSFLENYFLENYLSKSLKLYSFKRISNFIQQKIGFLLNSFNSMFKLLWFELFDYVDSK